MELNKMIKSILNKIIKKYNYNFKDPFTVAHDLSPFYHQFNQREELKQFNGIIEAKRFCQNWVCKHPWGAARILEGHHFWREEECQQQQNQ